MFAGIGRSLIPVLTPEYVVKEAVKAVLVNQEVLFLPSTLYWLMAVKAIVPAKAYYWAHRAIGAASTMKTFTGRRVQQPPTNQTNNLTVVVDPIQQQPQQQQDRQNNAHLALQMTPPDIGITVGATDPPHKGQMRLNQ